MLDLVHALVETAAPPPPPETGDGFYDNLRLFNTVTSIVVFVLTVAKAKRIWVYADLAQRLRFASLGAFIIAAAYGSIEAYHLNIPGGFRVTFTTGALVIGLIAAAVPDRRAHWCMFWYRFKKSK